MKIISLLVSLLIITSTNATSISDVQEYFRCNGTKDCKMLKKHINKDSDKCIADPKDVEMLTSLISSKKRIRGKIRYIAFIKGKYKYDAWVDKDNTLNIRTKIHFKNSGDFHQDELDYMQRKLRYAEIIWEQSNPYDFKVNFIFDIVKSKKDSYFSVKLKEKFTRGPYFRKWSSAWSNKTIAHEIGHVLGLDDEYKNTLAGGDASVCDLSSLMCTSHYPMSRPKDYYYYLVFRRLLCK